jgi:hypothetical protein
MPFSQQQIPQQIPRLSISLLCFGIVSLSACNTSNPLSSEPTRPEPANSASPAASPTLATSPTANASADTAAEQFAAILGTPADGWLPKILANQGLKKGLSPEATGKIISGAEKVSEYGFSKVNVENVPGLKQYEFYYAKDSSNTLRLESVKLHFDPALNQAYPDLVKVLTSKYGAAAPEDVEKQIITWVGPNFVTVQLMKLTDFGGYELGVSLEEE